MTDITILREPFETIRTRVGAGNQTFSYVAGSDVLERIIEATGGEYDWEILDIRLIEGQAKANKKTGEVYTTSACWMVHGRLILPGLGSKDGIGTATVESEESPKCAETDAMKRAAVKFGIALHLYKTDEHSPNGNQRRGNAVEIPALRSSAGAASTMPVRVINTSGQQCSACNAPTGKAHAPGCKEIEAEREKVPTRA